MELPFYIADAFTDRPFRGAQIGVFPKAEGLSSEEMQRLAEETNLPQTIFLRRRDGERYEARIFKPFREMNFAAQAIVAAGYVLDTIGTVRDSTLFETRRGPLTLHFFRRSPGGLERVSLEMAVETVVDSFTPPLDQLAEMVGVRVRDIETKRYQPKIAAAGRPFLVIPLVDRGRVREARFDLRAWASSTAPQTSAQEILLFSHRTGRPEVDFSARLVGPEIGPREDPPVGAAMPAFCAYLASFLRPGTYPFTVERGGDGSRRSLLQIEMEHRGRPEMRLRIGGRAVITARGWFQVP